MAKSDCVHAGEENTEGLIWCEKRQFYATGKEKDTCPDYQKK